MLRAADRIESSKKQNDPSCKGKVTNPKPRSGVRIARQAAKA